MNNFDEIKTQLRTIIADSKKAKAILNAEFRKRLNENKFIDSFMVYFELEQYGEWWSECHLDMSLSDVEVVYGTISADIHVMKVLAYHEHNIEEIVDLQYKYELYKAKRIYREALTKLLNNSRYGKKVSKGELPL